MDVTTKKIENGRYRVFIDGQATGIIIDKGPAPKYGNPQMWEIGCELADGTVDWLCGDQRGLNAALSTVLAIVRAAAINFVCAPAS